MEAAADNPETVVVVGNDTDLQCMLVEMCETSNVYIQLDTGSQSQIYNVSDAHKIFTATQLKVLTAIHCLTGCDTCLAPFSKGKTTAWSLLMKMKVDELQELQGVL